MAACLREEVLWLDLDKLVAAGLLCGERKIGEARGEKSKAVLKLSNLDMDVEELCGAEECRYFWPPWIGLFTRTGERSRGGRCC